MSEMREFDAIYVTEDAAIRRVRFEAANEAEAQSFAAQHGFGFAGEATLETGRAECHEKAEKFSASPPDAMLLAQRAQPRPKLGQGERCGIRCHRWKVGTTASSGKLRWMTDPPALACASNIAGSDAPSVAYSTVYPLATLLRILSAQILAIVLFR